MIINYSPHFMTSFCFLCQLCKVYLYWILACLSKILMPIQRRVILIVLILHCDIKHIFYSKNSWKFTFEIKRMIFEFLSPYDCILRYTSTDNLIFSRIFNTKSDDGWWLSLSKSCLACPQWPFKRDAKIPNQWH